MKERGFVLYEGPSLIDGAPIVVVATLKTSNIKTGDMVQTWILRSDIEPHHAVKSGDDLSICGDCIHRPANQGSCYVTVFQAPLGGPINELRVQTAGPMIVQRQFAGGMPSNRDRRALPHISHIRCYDFPGHPPIPEKRKAYPARLHVAE